VEFASVKGTDGVIFEELFAKERHFPETCLELIEGEETKLCQLCLIDGESLKDAFEGRVEKRALEQFALNEATKEMCCRSDSRIGILVEMLEFVDEIEHHALKDLLIGLARR